MRRTRRRLADSETYTGRIRLRRSREVSLEGRRLSRGGWCRSRRCMVCLGWMLSTRSSSVRTVRRVLRITFRRIMLLCDGTTLSILAFMSPIAPNSLSPCFCTRQTHSNTLFFTITIPPQDAPLTYLGRFNSTPIQLYQTVIHVPSLIYADRLMFSIVSNVWLAVSLVIHAQNDRASFKRFSILTVLLTIYMFFARSTFRLSAFFFSFFPVLQPLDARTLITL
jgi:hypothetical protein